MAHSFDSNMLDDDRIGRLLFKLALPAFFGMFVMALYHIVDTIFIGRYVGTLAIAGLSIVFPLQMLSMGIGQMAGMGGASLISRLIGKGDTARAERTLGNAMMATMVFSAILVIGGLAAPDFWLGLMGASENILPYAKDYMVIVLIGMMFPTAAMALNGTIRAEGNARIAMIGMMIGAVINIILDAIFIIPMKMGIQGAALATVIAQFISLGYLLFYYLSGNSYLKLRLSNLAIDFQIMRDILAIGVASFARTMATSVTIIFVNRMLITYGGDYAVSAFGVINRVLIFAIIPGITVGQGLQPILGYNYGAKRYDRVLTVIKIAMSVSTGIGIAVFLWLYFFPEPVIRIFTTDSGLIALSAYAAKRVFLTIWVVGFIMTGSLIFQSVGKVKQSFITSISRPFLFLLPLLFIIPQYLGLDGIWFTFPLADLLTLVLTVILLVPLLREFHRLKKEYQRSIG